MQKNKQQHNGYCYILMLALVRYHQINQNIIQTIFAAKIVTTAD